MVAGCLGRRGWRRSGDVGLRFSPMYVRSVFDAQSVVGKMLSNLAPEDQDKIVGLNTAELYNINHEELYWTKQAAE